MVRLPWRSGSSDPDEAPSITTDVSEVRGHNCPTLKKALDGLAKVEHPRILDLGPMCGDTIVFLAAYGGGHVSVEDIELPEPCSEEGAESASTEAPEPFRLGHADESFDLVLAWEHLDHVSPDRVEEFAAELRRILRPGGQLLVFSSNRSVSDDDATDRICRYRIVAEDRISREPTTDPEVRRWHYTNRRMEQLLEPLTLRSLHLQRTQMREYLAVKPVKPSGDD